MLRDRGPGRLRPVGQRTRSRSTTRRSPTALDRVGDILKNDEVRQRRLRRRQDDRHHDLPGRRPADPRAASARMHRQASLLRRQLARGHQGGRGRRRLRVLPAADRRGQRQAGPRRRRVHRGLRRPPRGPGVPDLPVHRRVGQREGQGHAAAAGSRPTRASTSPTWSARSTSCPSRSSRTRRPSFRFDGSDLMPAAVGAGSFWKEMTAWITGKNTKDALDNIESSWPRADLDREPGHPTAGGADAVRPTTGVAGVRLRRRSSPMPTHVLVAVAGRSGSAPACSDVLPASSLRCSSRSRSSSASWAWCSSLADRGQTGEELSRPSSSCCPATAAARLRPAVPGHPHDHPVVPWTATGDDVRRLRQLRARSSPSADQLTGAAQHRDLGASWCPFVATAIGLIYAMLVDRARVETFAKALIFLPMAISLVGASHHLEVRLRLPADRARPQIGLLNQILKSARLRPLPVPAQRTAGTPSS